ncbi:MAG TPA: methylisocitrate lyase [Candidatus Dormibacteraeota bacterium]|jgi:methylisocitrate lyase|nr:methylisocitrate lyase [Candidatus Dormibacteraeota bacterium]
MAPIITTAQDRRRTLREGLSSHRLLRFPGAFSPLVAALVEDLEFDGIYISGAALSADLALPDIGLTTLTEVSQRGHQIARVTNLPALIDADTGFGEPLNVARTIHVLEELGLAACHLEDQVNPKRCGHLDGKQLVSQEEMVRRVRAAVGARRDPDFVICARTDAAAVEGLDGAIRRAQAYVDAGADLIFPEALHDEREFEQFRRAIEAPLLANMTEFGQTPLLDERTLQGLGIDMVIYPVTTLRLAMGAVESGLRTIREEGTQKGLIDRMQHRRRLYELVDYERWGELDRDVYNFRLPD